jgi:hypothetical protein
MILLKILGSCYDTDLGVSFEPIFVDGMTRNILYPKEIHTYQPVPKTL